MLVVLSNEGAVVAMRVFAMPFVSSMLQSVTFEDLRSRNENANVDQPPICLLGRGRQGLPAAGDIMMLLEFGDAAAKRGMPARADRTTTDTVRQGLNQRKPTHDMRNVRLVS